MAMLVEMAGLADDPHPEARAEGGRTIPRILWRAILALLRPAESAARRLIIATSRGLAVPPPRLRQPKPATMEPILRRLGIAIMAPPAGAARAPILPCGAVGPKDDHAKHGGGGARHTLPLFDPPRRLSGTHRHFVTVCAAPRILVPGLSRPAALPPPPSVNDFVSAARLNRRLAALCAALDDLPGQARRFARWKAYRDAMSAQEGKRDAISAQEGKRDAMSAQEGKRDAMSAQKGEYDAQNSRDQATPRRVSPIRSGRPPGGRLVRYDPNVAHPRNIREVDEILAHAHALALFALENPDTS